VNAIFEEKPRFKNAPKICIATNLLAFKTEKAVKDFNNQNGHLDILAIWPCKHCACFHHWSGLNTGSNGKVISGSLDIPKRIQKLIQEAK
jgi:hypothetical protein